MSADKRRIFCALNTLEARALVGAHLTRCLCIHHRTGNTITTSFLLSSSFAQDKKNSSERTGKATN